MEYVNQLSYDVSRVAEMPSKEEMAAEIEKNKAMVEKEGGGFWKQEVPADEEEARQATQQNLNIWLQNKLTTEFYEQMWKVEDIIQNDKKVFASAQDWPGKTKADVLRELHSVLIKSNWVKDKNHKLDEDILEKLSKYPVARPGDMDFMNPFGYATRLFKSEAI